MNWDEIFHEVRRRRVGSGEKTIGAEEITWEGTLHGKPLTAVSRVRLNNPMESFMTSAGHRLRDSKVGESGHWVDIRIQGALTDADLALIAEAARAADDRRVEVSRGQHNGIVTWGRRDAPRAQKPAA